MEQEEKIKEETAENPAEEAQQQGAQQENTTPENTENKPPKRSLFRRAIPYLTLFILVGGGIAWFVKSHKEKQEYAYEYGVEPTGGYVSFSHGSSNIINPNTGEPLVKDIEWCHYSNDNDAEPIVLFAKNGKRGFCNIETGEVIVKPTTYTKAWVFSEGLAGVEKDGYIGFVNTKGQVAIGFRFSYRGNPLTDFVFHNGYCVVADSSNKIGVINNKGRWVIQPIYDHVELAKDYAIVYNDGEFKKQLDFHGNVLQDGIIDCINNLYCDVTYTDLQSGKPEEGSSKIDGFYEYRVGRYSGLINSQGDIITPPIYTDISGLTPTLFKATLQDWTSIVIIDQKGHVLSKVSK